jgi:hypothetical protein
VVFEALHIPLLDLAIDSLGAARANRGIMVKKLGIRAAFGAHVHETTPISCIGAFTGREASVMNNAMA